MVEIVRNKISGNGIKKKDKKLIDEIEIPEGILVSIDDGLLSMKREDKEISRKLHSFMIVKIDNGKIIISSDRNRKIERKLFGTYKAHIKNMIKGLQEGFTYKLQIANVHFPMSVIHDKEKNEIVVKNFLGEKKDRRINLFPGVEVKIDKEIIELNYFDIEKVGQTATNIEKGTRVKGKDRRVFQDGIFLVSRPGKEFL